MQSVVRALDSAIADLTAEDLILVACSGGADSLGLAVAAARLADSGRIRAGAIVIDHQLQPGSGVVAGQAAEQCRRLGLEPVEVIAVQVAQGRGNGGPEAAARTARRAALLGAAAQHDAKALLLAHTLEDQAETVLLGLARGSGSRSLAGIAPHEGLWRRPLLGCTRVDVRSVCSAAGITAFEDPHNQDRAYLRVRVRHTLLPALESELGPGVVAALARTAQLLRADCDALDGLAASESAKRVVTQGTDVVVTIGAGEAPTGTLLADLPVAIRTRVLRSAMLMAGCPPGSLAHVHLEQADRLISHWRGQGAVRLPADREVRRQSAKLVIYRVEPLPGSARANDLTNNR